MENNNKIPLLVLAGPTGIGKTDLSLDLAKELNGEIISCDSMQIYKYMDIGSAKIKKEEMRGIKHHLIDFLSPFEEFSVAQYKELASEAIKDIYNRGKYPIMVGGTGLYINSIVKDYNFTKNIKNEALREELQMIADTKGNEFLHNMLKKEDPIAFEEIHFNNVKRVIRALEVTRETGVPFSSQKESTDINPLYKINYYYLTMNRNKLYERIDERVDIMVKDGLIEEVKMLKDMGLNESHQSMQGIGYKEIFQYLLGKMTKEESINKVKQFSRNYAKRQLTWFRNDSSTKELNKDTLSNTLMIEYIKKNL